MAREEIVPPFDDDHNDDRPGDAHEPDGEPATGDFDPEALEDGRPSAPPAHDPFDPDRLGLSQDFAALSNVSKVWHTIKAVKPPKTQAFRTHHDPAFRLKTVLLVLKE